MKTISPCCKFPCCGAPGHYLLAVWMTVVLAGLSALGQDKSLPRKPELAARLFELPDDLRIDALLSEPVIAQPLFCNFDERGRLWLLEYRQYPDPAGLRVVSKDRYYRNVYDKIPKAPGEAGFVPGADRISIHEDTNGDGQFDSHKVFVDNLNIATSFCRGRGGVWVLNPPYLLFYPDQDQDDAPDSKPIVHLSGFGMEDTHSCTNSLRWGPDGWLYAAQGSTVSANIIRPGIDKTPVRSMGQLIWRYHPEQKRYEIFAEGGGNAFGVEVDSVGRVFSGHNGGDTRGFHYPQGGYLRKGFTKHGALSNPFAFGYFPHMKHARVQRFTHNFIIYEAEALPEKHRGNLFGIEPLQGRVVEADFLPRGSTFETVDLQHAVKTPDSWFTPVDIKLGPDGGIYVCDWYDNNVSHLEASVGLTDKEDGRVYRLTGKQAPAVKKFDLGKVSSEELLPYLAHPNRWFRQTALRLLGDRKDRSVLPQLNKILKQESGQLALESLWAIYQVGGLKSLLQADPLSHRNPHVRRWFIRLVCDEKKLPPSLRDSVAAWAAREPDIETRTQIASSAKRLATDDCLALVQALLAHPSDTSDPYQPLLIWWALESKCGQPAEILRWIEGCPDFWQNRLVVDHLATRLVKRFTLPGTRKEFLALAQLLTAARKANQPLSAKMLSELESTTRNLANLRFPAELLTVISKLGGASLEMQVRQNDMKSIKQAISRVGDPKTPVLEKEKLVRALGDIRSGEALPTLLDQMKKSGEPRLTVACLESLQKFDAATVGQSIVDLLPRLQGDSLAVAQSVLVSRVSWCRQLLASLKAGQLDPEKLSASTPRRMLFHADPTLQQEVSRQFGAVRGATDAALRTRIDEFYKQLREGEGSPYEGKKLFVTHCGKCHRLYQNGGEIGPNLTSYQRNDVRMMLLHVVNPNAEIREGFENTMFALDDGRVVSGFVREQDNQKIVVRTAEGGDVRIEIEAIENRKAVPQSLMPTGLLDPLTPQQRRDLFAFLRSTQPLNN
ncbi:MAG: PVC-type heme-binding CxxCH protein [Planctomycetota bacterium]|nr:PVC-type heme-binding CxxCH protein [Planctomycetota bacterium]